MAYTQVQINAINAARERAGANTPGRGATEDAILRQKYPLVEQIFGGRGYMGAGGAVRNAAINYIYGAGLPTSGIDQGDWFNTWQRQGTPQGTGKGKEVGSADTSFLGQLGQGMAPQQSTNYGITGVIPPAVLKQLSDALNQLKQKLSSATPQQRSEIQKSITSISGILSQQGGGGQQQQAGGGGGGGQSPPPPPAKSLFRNSAAYQALGTDAKSLVDLAFSSFSGTLEQQQIFVDALTQAQALADPYSKSQLLLFGAEFELAVAKTKNDYEAQAEILNRARTDLAAELKSNEDFLNLEQQSNLAKELKTYDTDLLTIAETAEAKGLTFATGIKSRMGAEERRGEQYQDVIQSTKRQYNFRIENLKQAARQGDIKAQKELENLSSQQGFKLQNIGQQAERVLGSTGLGGLGLGGFISQGGALGSVEQERRKSIIDIARLGIPSS